MFSKPAKQEQHEQPFLLVASREAPNDFKEVTLSSTDNLFFKALFAIMNDFDEVGEVTETSLTKFRDSNPLARKRIKELKGMKKTFLKELEVEANQGNEMIERSLRFYEALLEADRLRSTKDQKRKIKPASSDKV
ncbi:hypothetical protein HA402_007680 [Bradysia odoriphaga]|nr:hypothetical protein HA402_007680 [Bradysia odoriphaga]